MEHSDFTDIIVRANSLDFKEWAFCPGMLFGSEEKWWGDRGLRKTAHEGIDLLLYMNSSGKIERLNENIKVPALFDGTVVKIIDDFLGHSIFMEHESGLITAFGHTRPAEGIEPGSKIKQGNIITAIAPISNPNVKIAPHLHITAARALPGFSYDDLQWETIGSCDTLKLIDPLDIIGGVPKKLEAGSTNCNTL